MFQLWKHQMQVSPLDCKEIKLVHSKGNQSWIFIGKTDTEAETPILWPPDAKNWLIEKDPDAGKDWRQEKGTTEGEMVGWQHRLDGCEFEQALGVGDGQGGRVCCSPWRCKESNTTEWTELSAGKDIHYGLLIHYELYIEKILLSGNLVESLKVSILYNPKIPFLEIYPAVAIHGNLKHF